MSYIQRTRNEAYFKGINDSNVQEFLPMEQKSHMFGMQNMPGVTTMPQLCEECLECKVCLSGMQKMSGMQITERMSDACRLPKVTDRSMSAEQSISQAEYDHESFEAVA